MRYILISAIIISLGVLSGCGQKELEKKVAENTGSIENAKRKLSDDISALSSKIGLIESDLQKEISALNDSIAEISKAITELSGGEIDLATGAQSSVSGEDIVELKEELASLQETIASLRSEIRNVKDSVGESSAMPVENPRTDWLEMADPAKLAEKLDAFTTAFSPQLEETGRRSEFEADMTAYKEEATQEYTTEELLDKYKTNLQEQMAEARDDRMKEWYQRQLDALEKADERSLESRLTNYRRFQNMRELSDIARKYNISRNELRKHGLQIYGGGWTPDERRE